MDERRCKAMSKRSGKRCRRFPVPGGAVCVIHGGAAPAVRAAAERRQAEAQATTLYELLFDPDAPPVTNVVEALHKMAGQLEHSMKVLGARASTEALDGPAVLAWHRVVREQRQLLADIARLGIAEKHIELEQTRAELVVTAVHSALAAVPELLPDQRSRLIGAFLVGIGRGPAEEPVVVRGELG